MPLSLSISLAGVRVSLCVSVSFSLSSLCFFLPLSRLYLFLPLVPLSFSVAVVFRGLYYWSGPCDKPSQGRLLCNAFSTRLFPAYLAFLPSTLARSALLSVLLRRTTSSWSSALTLRCAR